MVRGRALLDGRARGSRHRPRLRRRARHARVPRRSREPPGRHHSRSRRGCRVPAARGGAAGSRRPRRRSRTPGFSGWRVRCRGVAADVVHFVGHGYLSGDEGALALASSPVVNTDTRWARFIGVTQLCEFMCRVARGRSRSPGRPTTSLWPDFAISATARRSYCPGVAVTHDLSLDPECEQLGLALQTMFAPGSPLDSPMPAMTCWVHPRFVETADEYPEDLHLNADGSSAFIYDSTREALARAGHRVLGPSGLALPGDAAGEVDPGRRRRGSRSGGGRRAEERRRARGAARLEGLPAGGTSRGDS